jgi:hypothetical protein
MFTQRLNTLGVAYMVSGSVAVIIYGEPRLTHHEDLIVVLDREHIARLPDVFPPAEFYCPPTDVIAVEAAREQRGHFNIIHHETGFKADGVSEWARSVARLADWPGRGSWKWKAKYSSLPLPSTSSCASSSITGKAARKSTCETLAQRSS